MDAATTHPFPRRLSIILGAWIAMLSALFVFFVYICTISVIASQEVHVVFWGVTRTQITCFSNLLRGALAIAPALGQLL